MTDPPERKKRRQNVACDSCRLRRVKCDLLELLPQPNDARPRPLHVLVREHPDVACTNCANKAIRCTTVHIVNPSKPNKGGRRIEAAKQIYGSDGTLLDTSTSSGPSGTNVTPSPGPMPTLTSPGVQPGQSADGLGSIHGGNLGMPFGQGVSLGIDPTNAFLGFDFSGMITGSSSSVQTPFGLSDSLLADSFGTQGVPTDSTQYSMWDALLQQPSGQGTQVPSVEVTPPMKEFTGFAQDFDPTHPPASFLEAAASDPVHMVVQNALVTLAADPRHASTLAHILGGDAPRKRMREDDILSLANTDKEPDPWSLWAPDPRMVALVPWGRPEVVGQRLADRALGIELSRHLIRVYFSAVHLTLPMVSPEIFYADWIRAGERSDRMKPDQEVLCAVIEAWAARFSDNPVVLGLDVRAAHTAPKVITENGLFQSDKATHVGWGRARRSVCEALVDRAHKLIDLHGILRKPSVTGVQALALFSQLQHMSDRKYGSEQEAMEIEVVHTIVCEQMRQLNVAGVVDRDGASAAETHLELPHLMRGIKERRIFWTMCVSDAFHSAGSGVEPRIADDDLEESRAWLLEVEQPTAPAAATALATWASLYFLHCFVRSAEIGRKIARNITKPAKRRPGRVDVRDFCNNTRSIWREIRDHHRDVNSRTPDLLEPCRGLALVFSPIHHFSSIRSGCPFLLLVVHQAIRELIGFRKSLRDGYVLPQGSSTHDHPEAARLAMLEELEMQSVDQLLSMCRAQMPMFKASSALISIGVLKGAAMLLRVLLSTAEFLSQIPTNEQGYPNNTPGGTGWTWQQKQIDVETSLEALEQMGWAWADVGDVVEQIPATMEKMRPTPEQLAAYASATPPPDATQYAARHKTDVDRDAKALDAVVTFWPPLSIPNAVQAFHKYFSAAAEPSMTAGEMKSLSAKISTWDSNNASPTSATSGGSGGSTGDDFLPPSNILGVPPKWLTAIQLETTNSFCPMPTPPKTRDRGASAGAWEASEATTQSATSASSALPTVGGDTTTIGPGDLSDLSDMNNTEFDPTHLDALFESLRDGIPDLRPE